jgi:hypothetical protein
MADNVLTPRKDKRTAATTTKVRAAGQLTLPQFEAAVRKEADIIAAARDRIRCHD